MKLEPAEIQALARAIAEELAARPDVLASPAPAPLMTTAEVAELLNVSPDTVRRYADDGKIPCVRFGKDGDRRFPRQELLALIDQLARGRAR